MNIHHLKYFISLANTRNFRQSAEACYVSQPAISMAIKAFEDKLGQKLFIRNTSPIEISPRGKEILPIAESIVANFDRMMRLHSDEEEYQGILRIGVIPTVAPNLIPLLLGPFQEMYPAVILDIVEDITQNLMHRIQTNDLDVGIFATPVENMKLEVLPLYYEEFMVYKKEVEFEKKYILPSEIDVNKLWMLEEGHCFRGQIINLCELKSSADSGLIYNAGSIETLINLVENYGGITIIPEMATLRMDQKRRKNIKLFQPPAPVREISLVYHKHTIHQKLIFGLQAAVLRVVPKYMQERYDIPPLVVES